MNESPRQRPMRLPLFAAALSLCLSAAVPALAQPVADSIWSGGPILTMNDKAMRAQAVAVAGGKIVAVGRRADVMKLKGPATQMVDLGGRTLVPGFVDAHGHVVVGGLQALSANLLAPPDGQVRDIASLQQTLRDWAQANAAAVEKAKVIIGFGYDPSQLKEQRHPTREELDAVSLEIPVLIIHQSSHLAAVNSATLKAMGYDASSKDPAGGVIQRKPGSTEPNGTLEETAFFLGAPKVLGGVGAEGFKAFAREGAKLWARFGYTTADEGRATPQTAEVLKQVAAEGGFANDVIAYPDVLMDRAYIKANQSATFTNRFRVAGAKLTIDGSPQGFTAWRDQPYYKPVGNYPPGYSGYAAATAEEVMGAVQWAYENGLQIITHSNGERASDLLIAAHRAAQARFPDTKGLRHVLIHGQFLREDQVDSYQALGVTLSLFPMHTFYWGEHLAHRLGAQARHDLLQPPRRAGGLPRFDARARRHRHAPRARVGAHRRPRAPRERDHRAEGDDDLAGLPPLRGQAQGQPGGRQAGRLRDPVQGPDRRGAHHHRRDQGHRDGQGRQDHLQARARRARRGRRARHPPVAGGLRRTSRRARRRLRARGDVSADGGDGRRGCRPLRPARDARRRALRIARREHIGWPDVTRRRSR